MFIGKVRISINKNIILLFTILLMISIVSSALAMSEYSNSLYNLLGFLWFIVLHLACLIILFMIPMSRGIRLVTVFGLLVRVVLSFVFTYFAENRFFYSDEGSFFYASRAQFEEIFTGVVKDIPYAQEYTTLLKNIYCITGNSTLAVRSINTLLWCIGLYVIYNVYRTAFAGRKDFILLFIYSFMPVEVFYYTNLMREPFITFSLLLALYFLWRWMDNGGLRYACFSALAAAPAFWLHIGNIGIYGVIGLTLLLWNKKAKRWEINFCAKQCIVLIAFFLLFPLMIWKFNNVSTFTFRINSLEDIFFIAGNYTNNNVLAGATSNYLPIIEIHSVGELIYWTLYKFFYFWMSPTPRFWINIKQAMGFFADTAIWIGLVIYICRKVKKKQLEKNALIVFLFIIMFGLTYGIGTSSAGTAMRHRGELLQLFIMCCFMIEKKGDADDTVSVC